MVTIGIASVAGRESLLQNTVNSLINQADKLIICLNNYERIPAFCYHPKVFAFLYDNEFGDAGKYFAVQNVDGYFFSCDDDIIYPPDYVEVYVAAIEKYQALITTHGRIMQPRPIASYYRDALVKVNCLNGHDKDMVVDVPGSGVSAFHTSFLKLQYSHFESPNMADIYLAKQCRLQNVNCQLIASQPGWLKYQHPEFCQSIYARHCNNDAVQTNVVNEFI